MSGTHLTLAIVFALASTTNARAQCNTFTDLSIRPSKGVLAFNEKIGENLKLPIFPSRTSFNPQEGEWKNESRPKPLTAAQIAAGTDFDVPKIESQTYFFEPDGQGNWRVCREEIWAKERPLNDYTDKTENSPWPLVLKHVSIYRYDNKGRSVEYARQNLRFEGAKLYPNQCLFWDKLDRLVGETMAEKSQQCQKLDPRDNYFIYKYAGDTRHPVLRIRNGAASEEALAKLKANPKSDVAHLTIDAFCPPASLPGKTPDPICDSRPPYSQRAVGDVENGRVISISATLSLADRTADLQSVRTSGYLYFFPGEKAPGAELFERPWEGVNYERVLEYGIAGNSITAYETFPAKGKATARYVVGMGTQIAQDLYRDGKPYRTLIAAPLDTPDFDAIFPREDRAAAIAQITVKGEVVSRAYEYDAQGKARLIGIAWREPIKPEGAARTLTKNIRGEEAAPTTILRYGLPDGTIKWKDFAEFGKLVDWAGDTGWFKRVYPNGKPRLK
ncbi:MAG TPA: hypothetical protein VLC92_04935 [Rhodocyclaceae bacterium]|nr:hypothetical protein [Rhodocyclaceae bacterium]